MSAKLVGGTTRLPIVNSPPSRIKSPFNISAWTHELQRIHNDITSTNDLLNDITHGVRIGYTGTRSTLISTNHYSAFSNSAAIAHELEREINLNRKIGPFLQPPFENFVGSPMGAIPKKRSMPVKWRIINDLSWPAGQSINNHIDKDSFSCSYDTMDAAITHLKILGKGALMSKLDLSDAFRHILVHREDWELLGSTWPVEIDGSIQLAYFFDAFLPFGLRSSPALFLRFADTMATIMQFRGVSPTWHYLDDFWTCGPAKPHTQCYSNLDIMLQTCRDLGFTVNPDKTVQPCTKLELLGIELDSVSQQARISDVRREEIMDLLITWRSRSSCTKRELQSLIGKLNFICSICRPGRTFLRRLIELTTKAKHATHHIRLTTRFFKDIEWWITFLRNWNGHSLFYDDQWFTNECLHLYTDACATSFGGLFGSFWFCETFHAVDIPHRRSITFKELFAITMAVTVWSSHLATKRIIFHCDNLAVVNIITSGSSKCPHIMSLMRYLYYICCTFNIVVKAVHIKGIENSPSDALSRLQVARFRELVPHALPKPTPVSPLNLAYFK